MGHDTPRNCRYSWNVSCTGQLKCDVRVAAYRLAVTRFLFEGRYELRPLGTA